MRPASGAFPKWARVLLVVLAFGVIGLTGWRILCRREPSYRGQPLSYWLRAFDVGYNSPQKPAFDEGVEAVRQSGSNAIPLLLHMLRASDSDLKHRFARLAGKQHVVSVEYVSADRQRWAARQGFVALGFAAERAIPQLVEIAQDEISSGEQNKYAGELLDLLKQSGDKSVHGATDSIPAMKPGEAATTNVEK